MALGDLTWQRQALIEDTSGAHHDEVAIASVSSNERLEFVRVSFYCNVVSSDSAVLQTWLDRGVLVVVQWTTATMGTPPTPDDIGETDLDTIDVLTSAYVRMGEAETFTNWHHVPKAGTVTIEAQERRLPPTGGSGLLWVTWGLADFAGAGVEVGFHKIYAETLVAEVS
jgi:hypothetical protein